MAGSMGLGSEGKLGYGLLRSMRETKMSRKIIGTHGRP